MMAINKIFYIFVLSILNSGAVGSPKKADFFIVRSKIGVVPPYASYNGWLIPGTGIDNGKGDSVFCCPVLKLIKMSKNVPGATGTSSAISAEAIIYDLVSTDEIPRMRQHLRDMLDSYLLSEDEASFRRGIYGTYLALDNLLVKSGERSLQ